MNDNNTDNDNNQTVVSSVEIAKANTVSLDSSSITSVNAIAEIEIIAGQFDTSSKEQLSKLVDIEKAIHGISLTSTGKADHN